MNEMPEEDGVGKRGDDNSAPDAHVGTPPWVYVFGGLLLLLAMVVIAMKLTGHHGPGRHFDHADTIAPAQDR